MQYTCKKCAYEEFILSNGFDIYPGLTLKELLKSEKITYPELSKRIGFSSILIAQICTNKRSISIKFAYALEKEFGISAEFWINLQNSYDLHILRNT